MSVVWCDHEDTRKQARDPHRGVKTVVTVCIGMLAGAFSVAIYAVGVHMGWWKP